jgi:hypothetical protein
MTNENNALAANDSKVVVTDIQMPFGSMVVFMIKWTLAAVPAAAILIVIGAVTFGILGGFALLSR